MCRRRSTALITRARGELWRFRGRRSRRSISGQSEEASEIVYVCRRLQELQKGNSNSTNSSVQRNEGEQFARTSCEIEHLSSCPPCPLCSPSFPASPARSFGRRLRAGIIRQPDCCWSSGGMRGGSLSRCRNCLLSLSSLSPASTASSRMIAAPPKAYGAAHPTLIKVSSLPIARSQGRELTHPRSTRSSPPPSKQAS